MVDIGALPAVEAGVESSCPSGLEVVDIGALPAVEVGFGAGKGRRVRSESVGTS